MHYSVHAIVAVWTSSAITEEPRDALLSTAAKQYEMFDWPWSLEVIQNGTIHYVPYILLCFAPFPRYHHFYSVLWLPVTLRTSLVSIHSWNYRLRTLSHSRESKYVLYIGRGMSARKVSNRQIHLQGHSRSLVLQPHDIAHDCFVSPPH